MMKEQSAQNTSAVFSFLTLLLEVMQKVRKNNI
jgi:hypothetical protein